MKILLPGLEVKNFRGLKQQYSGLDSPKRCVDKNHFNTYPESISYDYNSRGFRDREWPNKLSDLKLAIWCVGDSFTVGVGSAFENTWPQRLAAATGRRCINIAMDGASNQWIARRAGQICREIDPEYMVVQWSYIHRREQDLYRRYEQVWAEWYHRNRAPHWPDVTLAEFHKLEMPLQLEIAIDITWPVWEEETGDNLRRQHASYDTAYVDQEITYKCWELLEATRQHTQIIHSTIPAFCANETIDEFREMMRLRSKEYIEVEQQDRARDGHHYDAITAEWFARTVVSQLA